LDLELYITVIILYPVLDPIWQVDTGTNTNSNSNTNTNTNTKMIAIPMR
jgi:hypothetical protein